MSLFVPKDAFTMTICGDMEGESLVVPPPSALHSSMLRFGTRKNFGDGTGVVKEGVVHGVWRKMFPKIGFFITKLTGFIFF